MEHLPLVNSNGDPIGKVSRDVCHGNPELIHPVVHLHIINSDHKLFLQKRSLTKDLFPGFWDTAVGGHIGFGEEVREALIRESNEELGIDARQARFLYSYIMKNQYESEYVYSYLLHWDEQIHINVNEIAEGRFFSKKEIQERLGKACLTCARTDTPAADMFTPNFEEEFRRLIKVEGVF